MAERFLLFKSVEDLRLGDLYVSCFSLRGCEYPESRKIIEIIDLPQRMILHLEDGEEIHFMKDMKIIVQDKTPMVDPLKRGITLNQETKDAIKKKIRPLMPDSAYRYFMKWFNSITIRRDVLFSHLSISQQENGDTGIYIDGELDRSIPSGEKWKLQHWFVTNSEPPPTLTDPTKTHQQGR